jgi:hypothetical protein
MKFNLLAVIAALATSAPHLAFAQGTTGGGQGTRINGQLRLMDVVEGLERNTRCDWSQTLRSLFENHPEFSRFQSALDPLHAYVTQAFLNEASRVSICFAGELKSLVKPEFRREVFENIIITRRQVVRIRQVRIIQDPGHPVFQRINAKLETIGFRYGDKVIVDQKLYRQLASLDQLFFLAHELGHGFIPMDASQWSRPESESHEITFTGFQNHDAYFFDRPSRLWGLIHTLYQRVVNPTSVTAEGLARSLDLNQVTLPLSDQFWKRSPDAYRTVFARGLSLEQKSAALGKIQLGEAKMNLNPRDWEFLVGLYQQAYGPAQKIIQERYLGWERALSDLIRVRQLDPTLALPSEASLLDQALQMQDTKLLEVLVDTTLALPGFSGMESLGKALAEGRLPKSTVTALISRIDPNLREPITWSPSSVPTELQNYGRSTLFYRALQSQQLQIAYQWIQGGRITRETAQESISLLVAPSTTLASFPVSRQEQFRRELFQAVFALSGPTPALAQAAITSLDEYVMDQFLTVARLNREQLDTLLASPWASRNDLSLIQRAIHRIDGSINGTNEQNQTLLDLALRAQNSKIFELLVNAGAHQISKHWSPNQKYWALLQMIDVNQAAPLTALLNAHPDLKGLTLVQARDYAELRGKHEASLALQTAMAN